MARDYRTNHETFNTPDVEARMNRIYNLVWNKKRNALVATSEAVRSQGKGASGEATVGCVAGSGSALKTRLRLAAGLMSLVFSLPTLAHTDALGWIINPDPALVGKFLVDIYYGSWHSGGVGAEGALNLNGPSGFAANSVFSMVSGYENVANGTVPTGLALGSNYFFPTASGFSTTGSNPVYSFQVAHFSGLNTGDYTFGYAAGALSVVWTPSQPTVNAGAFTIGADGTIVVVGTGPVADNIDGHSPFDLSSGLGTTVNPVFEGGVLRMDTSGNITQNFTLDASTTSAIDQNGNHSNFTGVFSDVTPGVHGNITITNTGSGGDVTFSGINTYTGTTTIDRGATLALSGSGSIATSSRVIDNGSFDISATTSGASIQSLSGSGNVFLGTKALTLTNASGNFSGVIGGSGSLVIAGGSETLSGTNTYAGGTTISGGATVTISADANLGDVSGHLTLNNGTLENTASLTMARDIALAGNGTFNTNTGTTLTNTSGSVSGAGALIKQGDGTLILAGDLSHSGGTVVNAGTLALSGNNSYLGGTTLNGGTLKVGADNNLGAVTSDITINGGTLQTTGTMTSARNIAVGSSGGTLNTDPSTVLTLNGSISGVGNLTKGGMGTLILAGDNSGAPTHVRGTGWTGDLLINDGLVQVTNSWGLGWGNVIVNGGAINTTVDILTGQSISLAGGTKVTTDSGTTTTLSGVITTAASASGGCFIKDGQGALNLTGNATLSDGTCVQQGMLRANGTLNSNVTVDTGATLSGAGVINGAINVSGTLSPGNSPGFLTASSTVTMLTGSTFQEDIAGTTQASATTPIGSTGYYSYLHVTNGAQFVIAGGSTLAPMLKNIFSIAETGYGSPSFVPSIGQMYRIVTADGGISGRFSTLTQPDGLAANTRFAAFYNTFGSNSIDLAVLPTSYAGFFANGNENVRSAASALDRILSANQAGTGNAAQDQLLYVTAGKSAAQLPDYVKGLAGEIHGAVAAVVPQSGQWLQSSVSRQLNGASTASGSSDDSKEISAGSALWVDIASNYSNWKADEYASGFRNQRTQFAVGGDLLSNSQNRLGLGFSHASSSVSANLGSGSIDENMGFAYGQYAVSDLLIDGLAGLGTSSVKTQRGDPTGLSSTLKSGQHNLNKLVSVGIRAPLEIAGTVIEPFGRIMWQKNDRNAFSEGSAVAALSFSEYSASGIRSMVGISGNSEKRDPLAAPMTFRFTLGLGLDSGSLVRPSVNASLTGVETTITAPHVGRTFAQANLSGTFRVTNETYAYVGLTGETRIGKSDLGANAGVRMSF